MGFKLTAADKRLLAGVHPDLVRVFERAAEISDIRFRVTEGLRTVERQKQLVAQGLSKTMNSRHLTGHAVDIVPLVDLNGNGKYETSELYSWPLYYRLAPIIKQAAKELGVPIEWGGDWKSFKDGPHWQLPWKAYPVDRHASVARLVDAHPQYTSETDQQANTTALASAAGGTLTGASIAAEPVQQAIDMVTFQQGELTSGSIVRIAIAAIIIGASLWFAWSKTR